MRFLFLLMLLCLPSFGNQNIITPDQPRYSMEDLERQVSRKEFKQAVRHLRDIPQSDRSDHWKDLVEEATVGYLKELQRHKTSNLPTLANHFFSEYPFLLEAKTFCEEYNVIVLSGFKRCYESSTPRAQCTGAIASFFKKFPNHTGMIKAAADLAYKNDPPSKKEVAFVDQICPLLAHAALNDPRCSPKKR